MATLLGRRSVPAPGVSRDGASDELGGNSETEWSSGPACAKAARLQAHPRLRRSAGMTPAGCPRVWGARGRKDSGSASPPPNFARNLRTLRAPWKAAASGRPGPASPESSRRAGPATPPADPAAPELCGGRARSLARPLRTRRPPARLSAALSAAAARRRPPPPPPPRGSRPR